MKILNANPGFGTQLTEDEIRNFLGNSKLNIHIGTIDSKGDPNIHPTWYYFNVTNNKFYIETSKSSKKKENLDRNNLVYYVLMIPIHHAKELEARERSKLTRRSITIYQ
jgi:nitroimidazol reductase NimA-like FMN-containing flavoprotein (pyridoxamine 5'-phosphate oxidase superfamily)